MKHIVLAGGGHAHALLIRQLLHSPTPTIRWTCVADASHSPYSGMLPGVIAGHYAQPDMFIPLQDLCARAGVEFIQASVVEINAQAKYAQLNNGQTLHFDFISVAIGAVPALSQQDKRLLGVKPLPDFLDALEKFKPTTGTDIIGGGIASVEIALALAHRWYHSRPRIRLISRNAVLLNGHAPRVQKAALRALQKAHIEFLPGCQVDTQFPLQTQAIDCSMASANPGLQMGDIHLIGGFIPVNGYLQNPQYPYVFAAGDGAHFLPRPLPKAGVFAVREAPVLFHNLCAAAQGDELHEYHPQRQYLTLIACGDKTALASRGFFSAAGKWVWWWKNKIDTDFIRSFR